ncbi:hypothetical protein [Streptomyces varsoviensis]|uniref:PEP-CTERM sorting domain-containing protein n=1 Tax=Streptomyces varsoviensis TaxID=67373 RepID=A0ABR5J2A2_9ACTN|nr:hypothetical protein [Streptomyces varsoviensis]KOG87540.1 hypothetical protein ADK38_24855 [Streptomyces varsoviensis]
MLVQTLKPTGLALDKEALGHLMTQPETEVSDAPIPAPEGVGGGSGVLLAGLIISPKAPKRR